MSELKYLNVEMRVTFNVPVDEDFDIDEFSEEDLEEIANDYFFSEEIAELFIKEFGDEIKEVLC